MPPPASFEEIERAQKELTRIGGLTPIGKPWLMLRWGASYTEPDARGNQRIKYWLANTEPVCTGYYYRMDDGGIVRVPHGYLHIVPEDKIALPLYESEELGERRWIIEQWRTPEFIDKSGRNDYDATHDNLPELLCCRRCQTPKPERGKRCPECGETEEYHTKGDGRRLIAETRGEGRYDFFMRLEGRKFDCEKCEEGVCDDIKHASYRPVNALTLQAVENLWNYQQKRSYQEKTADNEAASPMVTMCNGCMEEIEPMVKCRHCGSTRQTTVTRKNFDRQRAIWSIDNLMKHKDRIDAEKRRGLSVAVPTSYGN